MTGSCRLIQDRPPTWQVIEAGCQEFVDAHRCLTNSLLTTFGYSMNATETTHSVYFDGGCPVCTREIAFLRRQEGADQLNWVDVTRCDGVELGPGLSREAALDRFHVRRQDGVLVSGSQAFVALWSSLPRWAWAGRLLSARPLRPLLEAGYNWFLTLRKLWRRH